MSYSKEELIEYRKNQAKKSLDEAKLLIENNFLNSAVNRLYYACYYMITALLADRDLKTKTHSGVKICLTNILLRKVSLLKNQVDCFLIYSTNDKKEITKISLNLIEKLSSL